MTGLMISKFKCPACNQPLVHSIAPGDTHIIWCGQAMRCPCASLMNEGSEADSEAEAFLALVKAYDRWDNEQPD